MNTDQQGLETGFDANKARNTGCGKSAQTSGIRVLALHRGSSGFIRGFCLLLFLGASLFSQRATAQLLPPDDFFHAGAMAYLSNNVPAALESVTNGLAVYPNDEKLQKLQRLLKQQQQQNQNQQQNQQQKDPSQKDQPKDQNQNQQQQNKDKADQEKQKKEQQEKDRKKQDEKDQKQPDQQQAQKSDDQTAKPEEQPAVAGQMTPQEAKQLLDAQKNDEAMLPISRADKPRNRATPLKDW